jgi:hypothetical protein
VSSHHVLIRVKRYRALPGFISFSSKSSVLPSWLIIALRNGTPLRFTVTNVIQKSQLMSDGNKKALPGLEGPCKYRDCEK